MIFTQSIEQAQIPQGMILSNDPIFDIEVKPLWYTKNGEKFCDWLHAKEEPSKDTILCDKSGTVKLGFCRICKNKIKPYSEKFYKKYHDGLGDWSSFLYCEKNSYCKECSIKETADVVFNPENRDLRVTGEKVIFKDDQEVRIKTYADGSTLTEMTETEKSRDTYFKSTKR